MDFYIYPHSFLLPSRSFTPLSKCSIFVSVLSSSCTHLVSQSAARICRRVPTKFASPESNSFLRTDQLIFASHVLQDACSSWSITTLLPRVSSAQSGGQSRRCSFCDTWCTYTFSGLRHMFPFCAFDNDNDSDTLKEVHPKIVSGLALQRERRGHDPAKMSLLKLV